MEPAQSRIGRFLAQRPEWRTPERNLRAAQELEAYARTVPPGEAAMHLETAAEFRRAAQQLAADD